ncbi:hypothetical protein Pmani_003370 [Petrolisthes manimaculis]|uniref:Uncharacterized protein n=1 Tax=Petrolisthes manimaculis TaxID=1843537 RepID=A0AAE1UII3_9EUCA|nr:hypothetical protein Pmani_003370 [Petrolisthes manimaculis]
MSDWEKPSRTPRRSSSTPSSSFDRKRCEKISPERDTKKNKLSHEGVPSQSPVECASPPCHYLGPVV